MIMPKFVLKDKFGKSNREVRDYDAIVQRYQERLEGAKGMTFGPSQNMRGPNDEDKHYLPNRLKKENKKLQHKVQKWQDND